MFLKDQIVGDDKKNNESQSSLEISIIPTSISPLVAHDDHRGAEKDNNDDLAKLVEHAPF